MARAAQRLADAAEAFTRNNQAVLGDKWTKKLGHAVRELRRGSSLSIPQVLGTALWIFAILGNLGVQAGLGLEGPSVASIPEELDEETTVRLLEACSYALRCQLGACARG